MDIRKISIGADYKSGAMHYIVGQSVLGGKYNIHLIQQDDPTILIKFGLKNKEQVVLWKEFKNYSSNIFRI